MPTPIDLVGRLAEALAVQSAALEPVGPERAGTYRRHAAVPGHLALGTLDRRGRLVGFAYGAPDGPDQWWHQQVEPAVSAAGLAAALDGAFVVTELHVLPAAQGRGLGRALLLTLCRAAHDAGAERAVLSARSGDTPARRLYGSAGFRPLVEPFTFPGGGPPYGVLGAPLPLPAVLDGA